MSDILNKIHHIKFKIKATLEHFIVYSMTLVEGRTCVVVCMGTRVAICLELKFYTQMLNI